MKKIIATIIALSMVLSLVGCGQPKTIDGKTYETKGLFTKDEEPCINYEVSVGNVIWSVILIESVAFPIYFIGFSMYNPISKKQGCTDK